MNKKVTIIGDGAMGTVCGLILTENGFAVTHWCHDAAYARIVQQSRENSRFLPGIELPDALSFTGDDAALADDVDFIVSAVPCAFLRPVLQRLATHVTLGVPIVSVTKGIENDSLARPTQIVTELTGPRPIAVLSGPNIADELQARQPASSTIASEDQALAQQLQQAFNTGWFRVYTNSDLLGVELAGATKNVIAIAAGILDGMKAGDNAKAALLTRGLAEIMRLGVSLGARPETFAGLSGMGDLITTCISPRGRNRTFGQLLAQGNTPEQAFAQIPGQVEGVNTTRSLMTLIERQNVEMPLTSAVVDILFHGKSVPAALEELFTRPLKAET